ncbi:MAG TPA: transporter [Desulfuromonas sp.]|nr:transporter [Desulfuromonas sp.]
MPFFSRIYRFFAPRRRLLYGLTLTLLLGGAIALTSVHLTEDIGAMLPDDGSQAATDFHLLQQAPFVSRIVIQLQGEAGSDLSAAADQLAAQLTPPLFSRVLSGPGSQAGQALLPVLEGAQPALFTSADAASLAKLDAAAVRQRLESGYARLLTPEGLAFKDLLRSDPLDLRQFGLAKLRQVSLVPNARLRDGHFASADGSSLLLVAETPIPLTDSRGGAALLRHFATAAATLPAGVTATLVSGHRYTLANADAIKRDLAVVLSLSSLAVLAIYLVFLRSWQGLFVFLVPAAILLVASGAVALLYAEVFAVTLGFGGVLLGIADEYAMHVYFACRQSPRDRGEILGEVAGPVIFGACATLASFAVMLVSVLPGQRQLAIYAMIGIAAALLLSLVVLPHLVRPAPTVAGEAPASVPLGYGGRWPRRWVIGVWAAILMVSAVFAVDLRFNGELRAMSLVPDELRRDEARLSQVWGDIRGKAMIVCEGADLDSALAANERLYATLVAQLPATEVVSLAPLLPAAATQAANQQRWVAFWQGEAGRTTLAQLAGEGRRLGFAPAAFAPFRERLLAPAVVTPETLHQGGLGAVLDALLVPTPKGIRLLTLVPDTAAVRALFSGAGAPTDGHLVSQARFGEIVGAAIKKDFSRYLVLTMVVVLVLVIAVFRDMKKILLTLVPVVTGLLVMFGVMGLCGIPFNLFNIVATVLIIGLCVDYGIFMVCKVSGESDGTADRSVLVSGLTTLAGFGVLILARHPAMHSIGVTVMLGIGAAIPAALLVIPALYRGEEP